MKILFTWYMVELSDVRRVDKMRELFYGMRSKIWPPAHMMVKQYSIELCRKAFAAVRITDLPRKDLVRWRMPGLKSLALESSFDT